MLLPDERHYISSVLAFFASSDGIVMENLAVRFMRDVQMAEVGLAEMQCTHPFFFCKVNQIDLVPVNV